MKRADLKKNVDIVFAHWQKAMDHPTAKLLPVRERAIRARLAEGYSVDEIKRAIDGCRASAFHQGQNDTGTVYDDLTLICRNGAKLEFFISLNSRPPRNIDRIAISEDAPSADTVSTDVVRCKTCGDLGMVDSEPNNPGFVPNRRWLPCPDCHDTQ